MHSTHNPLPITRNPAAEIFAFSSKERDVETGLSYFGARYYSSDLSIWLSVDPMSGKYPSLSPYVYCADNPVKLVDPNGEEIWFPDVDGNLIAQDGDNYKSLAVTINCSYNKAKKILANQGYKDGVNEGDKVNLDNPYTRSINATCEQRLTDDQAVAYALQWNKLGLSDEEMELRYKELACPQDLYSSNSAKRFLNSNKMGNAHMPQCIMVPTRKITFTYILKTDDFPSLL